MTKQSHVFTGVGLAVACATAGLAIHHASGGAPSADHALRDRAAWIHEIQMGAGSRYDFQVDGVATGHTRVGQVAFETSADGLAFAAPDHAWSAALRLVDVGRGDHRAPVGPSTDRASGNMWIADHGSVIESWISGPLGIEQIVDVGVRPAGEGTLVLDMAVEGLRAFASSEGVDLRDATGATRAHYTDLLVSDAHGATVPAELAVVGGRIELRVHDADAAYPLVIDPLVGVQQAQLLADNGAAGDNFGQAVAFDGTMAVIGAPNAHGIADGTGAVYVFTRTGTTWSAPTRLAANDGQANDLFGSAVAFVGSTLVVGSPGAAGASGNPGAAYVFTLGGTGWTQTQRLVATGGLDGDSFGSSIAYDGTNIVIGAPYRTTAVGGAFAGSAYVFTHAATWTQAATLSAPDGASFDVFGISVATAGGTIAVGASNHAVGGASHAGAVYVFTGSGTAWAQQGELAASDGVANDSLGVSVAVNGNLVVAGASGRSPAGSLVTFTRTGTTWAEGQRLVPTAATDSAFGQSVAIDASGTTIVGGTSSTSIVGFATVFGLSGGTWSQTGQVVAGDGMVGDVFGSGVGISSDTVVVGAYGDTTSAGAGAGSAYAEVLRDGNGDACSSAAACASGFCVDGVCCNTACGGGAADCQACSVATGGAVDGTCGTFASGTTCRAAVAGGCDVAETCNGTATTCPADVVAPSGTSCRAAMGVCDVADTCDGTSPTCTDNRVAAGTVCRPSTGSTVCDPAETCSASSVDCPPDTNTDGTSCSDSLVCDGMEICMSGACAMGTAPDCMDTDACTTDTCAEPAGCTHTHIAGCCNVASDCDDGMNCTMDICSGAGGTCSHMAIAGCTPFDAGMPDAGPLPDAGHDAGHDAGREAGTGSDASVDANVDANVDSGTSTPPSANCGCSTVGTSTGSAAAPFGLFGLALIAVARRRRR